jgi:Predicted AAA-ATPase/PD-(D/E)XK nuclease superfamily
MALRIPIGIDDFRTLRERGLEYVDKTHLIRELIDRPGVAVALLPRPRRFGKSLNLSMLRWFFEKRDEDLWHLFDGLSIARAGAPYRAHFQRYPVVHLSFKGTRAAELEVCRGSIRLMIRDLFHQHVALLERGSLDAWERADFLAVLDGHADEATYRRSLLTLTSVLHRAHGERVVVLIDEYDAPIHAGWAYGYYGEMVDFFRTFFEAGLKDNPHLHQGVLTGILRVAKESIFSGLNNLGVYTLLQEELNTCFGFTEEEVAGLLEKAAVPELFDAVRGYYNGYLFGGRSIYNPWSILHFVASTTRALVPYWVGTSGNDLVKELLLHHAFAVHEDIESLLERGSIAKKIDENIVFPDLRESPQAVWSLLVFSGYLRAEHGHVVPGKPLPPMRLSIPNEEVFEVYKSTFQSWLERGLRAEGGAADALLDALLEGDAKRLEDELQRLATHVVSFHDAGGRAPERFYHGLMLGLLASLEPEYEVRSNRESGSGRPDVWVKPRTAGKAGVVLELKTAGGKGGKGKTLAAAVREGLAQVRKKDYAAELRAAGAGEVHALVVAFDGKRVRVEAAEGARPTKGAKPKGKTGKGRKR